MKKIIFILAIIMMFFIGYNVYALTNNGKLYEQYYNQAKVFVFASDETYHSMDYNGILIKSSADDEIYYCIEPEYPLPLYEDATYNSHTIYEGKSNIINQSRLTKNNYDRVSLLAYYGYGYKDNKINHNSKKWYGITQVLIWQTLRKDINYVFKTSRYGSLDSSLYKEEIKEIETLINNHNKIPSFASSSFILTQNETKEVIDTNNVLSSFIASSSDIVKTQIKDNTLLITALKDGEDEIEFTKFKTSNNFRFYKSNLHQNIISRGNIDMPSFKIKVKVASGSVIVKKIDETTKEYNTDLNGTLLEITDENNKQIKIVEIKNNQEEINLPYGTYYLKELAPTYSYTLNENIYKFTIDEENKNIVIEIENKKIKTKLILKKLKGGLDEEYSNECDAEFEIYKDNILISTLKTDINGIATIDLEYGKYLIHQKSGSIGYSYIKDFYVFINSPEKYEYELKNVKKSIIEIKKIDYSSKIALSGTKLAIYDINDNLIYEGITDINGIIRVGNLDIGKYYIKEIEASKYYKKSNEKIYFDVTEDGKLIDITITNERNKGTLEFTKVDNKTLLPLENALIRITYLDTNEILFEGLTNKDGTIILENINAGNYKIEEINPPYGYLLSKEIKYFELTFDNEIIKVDMENEKIEMPNTYQSINYLFIFNYAMYFNNLYEMFF